jgi:hypothetical protein
MTTPFPYTLLTQSPGEVLRLLQQPGTTTLQQLSDRPCVEISLDDIALQALLRALPRPAILAALIAQADAEDLAALAALDGHTDCPVCGLCQVCLLCTCPALQALGNARDQGAAPRPDWAEFAATQLDRLPALPCRVDQLSPDAYSVYQGLAIAVAALQALAADGPLPAVPPANLQGWRNPCLGGVCACDQHPGVHVADAACEAAAKGKTAEEAS